MISGRVTGRREAVIPLDVGSASQPFRQFQAVIDTGFNGSLTLPSSVIAALQLPFAGHRRGTLADGSTVVLDVYLATVLWHGRPKDVLVSRAAGDPLVGMALLDGNRLTMAVRTGGDVSVDEMP